MNEVAKATSTVLNSECHMISKRIFIPSAPLKKRQDTEASMQGAI